MAGVERVSPDGELDARRIVGLLADADRLRVVSAVVLGSSDMAQIALASGLDAHRVRRALGRLTAAGLVAADAAGHYSLSVHALEAAARSGAEESSAGEHGDAPPERARVLRAFLRGGRLVSIPAARSKRGVVLDYLAQHFEPGRRYPEAEVNAMLRHFHPDVAALRRYLVDEQLMDREGGEYWRTGGTFDVD